jgi:TusE/DsrC/DsvC family sulfur relay protein
MPYVDYKGTQLEVDEDGFIADPTVWNDDLAVFMADTAEDIHELTPDHWKVIHYLHKYYGDFGVAPMVRRLCKETGCTIDRIYELFPSGPAKGACKIAGLPKPTGCV